MESNQINLIIQMNYFIIKLLSGRINPIINYYYYIYDTIYIFMLCINWHNFLNNNFLFYLS